VWVFDAMAAAPIRLASSIVLRSLRDYLDWRSELAIIRGNVYSK
jgi:hypothetical protein